VGRGAKREVDGGLKLRGEGRKFGIKTPLGALKERRKGSKAAAKPRKEERLH